MPDRLKLASWNINSVRFRIDGVVRFLDEEQPDILCLQETKVVDPTFPAEAFRALGFVHQVLNGQPMHHGVAILSRLPLFADSRHDWQDNGEARHVGARLANGVRIENVYVPAGGDVPDRMLNPKFGQKLDFIERMTSWSRDLAEPTIMVGDFNIAPLECDVWSHKQLLDVVSHTPDLKSRRCPRSSKPETGSTSAASFLQHRRASTRGGVIAPRTGRYRTGADGSTMSGLHPIWPTRRRRTASTNHAVAGKSRRTMSPLVTEFVF